MKAIKKINQSWSCKKAIKIVVFFRDRLNHFRVYWKLTPSDKRRWKKKITRVSQENEKATRNKIIVQKTCKGDKAWAVLLITYSEPFLKWTIEELKQMDMRTRNITTMLNPRDDVDTLHVSKKEWADLPSLKIALTHRYNDYMGWHEGR